MRDDEMTNYDVLGADEIADYDRAAEAYLDAEDERRWAAEEAKQAAAYDPSEDEECIPELVDGTYIGCGACDACQP